MTNQDQTSPPPRVLVVDDEAGIRHFFAAALGRAGYAVEAVGEPRVALARLMDYAPDLVITDGQMPGMSGPEFVRELRKHPVGRSVPVVAVSGTDTPFPAGILRLQKPVLLPELLRVVAMHLAEPRPAPALLRELPACPLPLRRQARYGGGGHGLRADELQGEAAQAVRRLYDLLGCLESGPPLLSPEARGDAATQVTTLARAFGAAVAEGPRELEQRKVVHDLRGASLMLLVAELESPEGARDDMALRLLARAHRKQMRSLVEDLDPAGQERDRQFREHTVQHLLGGVVGVSPGLTLHTWASYDGPVSESCLELSALERAFYNLLNNAIRHTADGTVSVMLTAEPSALRAPPPEVTSRRDLRICFVNRVEREHAAVLAKATAHGAAAMVLAGFSTTASGLGLRVCAELVQEAYGLDSVRTCIEQGYCGVRVCGDEFLAWLHWPLP